MLQTVYVINSFLNPMKSCLNESWQIIAFDALLSKEDKEAVTALATTVWDKVDSLYLSQFPNLKVVCHLGIGTDNIDTAYLKSQNIQLCSQPDAGIHDTAELALALMLALQRNLIPNHQWACDNQWAAAKKQGLGSHLKDKKVGLLGFGKIGRQIAEFAGIFKAQVAYTASSDKQNQFQFFSSLAALASWCDFLVVCCSGGEQTRHLVNAQVLKCLSQTSYLVNVARGTVVDERALIAALEEGRIAGAALDVFENEPDIPKALRKNNKVILSPHMGSSTRENLKDMFELQAAQLNNYLTTCLL